MKDSKIINLSVSKLHMIDGKNCELKIKFNDSLLLLPASLKKLSKAFGVTLKGDFDHTRSSKCTTYQDLEAISAKGETGLFLAQNKPAKGETC